MKIRLHNKQQTTFKGNIIPFMVFNFEYYVYEFVGALRVRKSTFPEIDLNIYLFYLSFANLLRHFSNNPLSETSETHLKEKGKDISKFLILSFRRNLFDEFN